MTPLKLELSGFTCFRNAITVDFSALELFAISGPTGSGKSTLLDAMTYALYGQTARLGSKGLDALLSPGLMQMYVVLEFQTSRGTYKVTRTVDKRASGTVTRNTRIEELLGNAQYRQLPESEKLKEADAKLEQLVGLDYDGFTRSVLLPQGAFDEFLRGDTSKRRKLLVSLLGLDRVEAMQKAAGRKAREADIQQKALTERLEQDYGGATPERISELREAVAETNQQLLDLNKKQENLIASLKEQDELKGLLDEKETAQTALKSLYDRTEVIERKREQFELAKKAERLAPHLNQLKRMMQSYKNREAELKELTGQLSAKSQALEKAQQSFEAKQAEAEKRLPEIEKELGAVAEVKPLLVQLKSRGGRLELAQQVVSDLTYSEPAWEAFQESQAQLPLLRHKAEQLSRAKDDLGKSQEELGKLSKDIASTEEQLQHWVERGKEARNKHNEAKLAYETALLSNQAMALREHLHDGDTCPVCEQTIKTLPAKVELGLSELKSSLETFEFELDKAINQYRDVNASLSGLKERQREKLESGTRLEAQHKELDAEVAKLLKALKISSVAEAESYFVQQRQALLASLAEQIVQKTDGHDPEHLEAKLQKERRILEAALKDTERDFQNLNSGIMQDRMKQELLQKQQTESAHELETAQQTLDKELKAYAFQNQFEAEAAFLSEGEQKALEAELTSYQSQRESYERRDVELGAKIAGRSLDFSVYASQKQEAELLKSKLAAAQTNLGRLESELKTLEDLLKKAKSLEKDRAAYQRQHDTYRALSQDLQGNRFQEFLLSQVQAKLAVRASHILRDVTDGRYDLRLIDGDYQVRDAWAVGETRSAKTLSGGETFIASLALALALSDTIAGSHALGALFLDEGFGTLDAITLDSVAAVLENLTREGRMVGIITHVTALTERLPARLTVSKDKEGSSISWDLA
ncbi:MAG: SMC family ATPase [Trueperaceae bacterium]|nr:SMC family ATPase [Trueperaceae bacterium]